MQADRYNGVVAGVHVCRGSAVGVASARLVSSGLSTHPAHGWPYHACTLVYSAPASRLMRPGDPRTTTCAVKGPRVVPGPCPRRRRNCTYHVGLRNATGRGPHATPESASGGRRPGEPGLRRAALRCAAAIYRVVLRYATPCHAMLCYAMLCCALLRGKVSLGSPV